MNGQTRPERTALPLDVLDQIDRICDRFEATWDAGQRPRVEDYLGEVAEPYQPALLRDLLAAELDARRRRGERPEPREYRDRFPGETAVVAAAFASPPIPPARLDTKTLVRPAPRCGRVPGTGIGPDSVGRRASRRPIRADRGRGSPARVILAPPRETRRPPPSAARATRPG